MEVVGDANRIAVRQEEACRRYVELRAYPFRAQAQRLGDAVIGLYADGCIVRLSGDALIAPEGVDLSSLDASAFRDDDGARRDWGFYMSGTGEGDASPTFNGFCRVYGDYYYVDLAAPEKPFDLLIVSVEGLSNLRIPRLALALCVALLFFITAVCWVLSAGREYRNPSADEKQRKLYGPDRVRRSVVVLGLAGMLSVGVVTFFINCLTQLYTVTESNNSLLESYRDVADAVQRPMQKY